MNLDAISGPDDLIRRWTKERKPRHPWWRELMLRLELVFLALTGEIDYDPD